MDFDKLMARYDSLVRENASLRAELETAKEKGERLRLEVDSLKVDLDRCRKGEEKTHYQVAWDLIQDNTHLTKIDLIKAVRQKMGWGLKEAKDAVDKLWQEI